MIACSMRWGQGEVRSAHVIVYSLRADLHLMKPVLGENDTVGAPEEPRPSIVGMRRWLKRGSER